MAYWLSGDGHYRKSDGRITIATNSFTREEVDKLRSILLTKYQLESSSVAQGSGKEQYVLYIPKREVPKLQALVKSHMPASMLYRIGF